MTLLHQLMKIGLLRSRTLIHNPMMAHLVRLHGPTATYLIQHSWVISIISRCMVLILNLSHVTTTRYVLIFLACPRILFVWLMQPPRNITPTILLVKDRCICIKDHFLPPIFLGEVRMYPQILCSRHSSMGRFHMYADLCWRWLTLYPFAQILEDEIRFHGAPDRIVSDMAKAEISKKVEDILWKYIIDAHQSEPYQQQQNPVELSILDIKRYANYVYNYSSAPPESWVLTFTTSLTSWTVLPAVYSITLVHHMRSYMAKHLTLASWLSFNSGSQC